MFLKRSIFFHFNFYRIFNVKYEMYFLFNVFLASYAEED